MNNTNPTLNIGVRGGGSYSTNNIPCGTIAVVSK